MTNESLARSYLRKASDRLGVLELLLEKEAYSDVVREAQEIVELALKGMLRAIGIEPPKLHDVGGLLHEHRERFTTEIADEVDDLALISMELRKERELAFYGDVDFIPTDEYSLADAEKAKVGAEKVVRVARRVIDPTT
jgi:HEPN domain-containing protein